MISYRLFIEGEELVLNEDVQVAITKQFEDITNPTVIVNDWSKTVNIPVCEVNNRIFGHLYDPKKTITSSSEINQKLTGIYFDPTKKLDFRLEYGSSVVMVGYAKMNSVTKNKGKGTYNLTLNGELGKVFQELSKITFNINEPESEYIIDGSQYVDSTITKDLVYSSWTSNGQSTYDLDQSSITDIIGFAPNNSYYEEFDPKSFQDTANSSKLFTDVLKNVWDDGQGGYVTGIDPETVLPSGLLPREIGEFRSYYQTPFIYWNKLWQIFKKKSEQLTGYTWDLDLSWFSNANPYYSKLVYMLKPFNVKKGDTITNHYSKFIPATSGTRKTPFWNTYPATNSVTTNLLIPEGPEGVSSKTEAYKLLPTYGDPQLDAYFPHVPTWSATFECPDEFSSMNFKWTFQNLIVTPLPDTRFRNNAGLVMVVKLWGCDDYTTHSNPRLVQENKYLIVNQGSSLTLNDHVVIEVGASDSNSEIEFAFNSNFNATSQKCGPYCFFTVETRYTTDDPFDRGVAPTGGRVLSDSISLAVELSQGVVRSGNKFTLNDLWNNDFNLFEQILNYCKMFRILVFADYRTKKLKFIPATKYFSTYTVTDWTDKLDISKDYTLSTPTFDTKYVLFNYTDNDTNLGKQYKDRWGVDYGEKKIITNYNFNNEDTDLFEKEITTSITNTDNCLSWSNLYERSQVVYSLPAEIFPYSKDKDNKFISNFGAFFFHNGKRYFDTEEELHLRNVSLSDDTVFQQSNNTFFYSQQQNQISVTSYPALDIVYSDGEKLSVFNTPSENYTYNKNLSGTKGIYDEIWKCYIDERYNIQNKLVTCYIKLTPLDFINFDYKNLVTINGALFMVNKIYDYNIAANKPTKVDLVTISDLSSYFTDYYSDYLTVSPSSVTLNGSSGQQSISVTASLNNWDFEVTDVDGNKVNPDNYQYKVEKTDNSTLVVTKKGDYTLNFFIRIFTKTREIIIPVTGSKIPYFNLFPASITARKSHSDEFYITVETNNASYTMTGNSVVQWWDSDSSQWRATTYTRNNYLMEDIEDIIRVRIVNPMSDGSIVFTSAGTNYYLPVNVIDANTLVVSPSSINVSSHGGTIFNFTITSSSSWEFTTYPQQIHFLGGMSGEAGENLPGTISVDDGGIAGTSIVATVENEEGNSATITMTYQDPSYVTLYDSNNEDPVEEDFIDYHGTTKGYYVHSSHAWEVTLPQGVQSYGPTSGEAGETSVTFSYPTGEPGTSKTLHFSNTSGASFDFVVNYVI